MATTSRTTISAVVSEFAALLQANLVAVSPTPEQPFRAFILGKVDPTAGARPLLGLRLSSARPVGVTDDDKIIELSLGISLAVNALLEDPHAEFMAAVSALENYLDSLRDTGILAGAEGLDNGVWTFSYPPAQAGSRVMVGDLLISIILRVARESNDQQSLVVLEVTS